MHCTREHSLLQRGEYLKKELGGPLIKVNKRSRPTSDPGDPADNPGNGALDIIRILFVLSTSLWACSYFGGTTHFCCCVCVQILHCVWCCMYDFPNIHSNAAKPSVLWRALYVGQLENTQDEDSTYIGHLPSLPIGPHLPH